MIDTTGSTGTYQINGQDSMGFQLPNSHEFIVNQPFFMIASLDAGEQSVLVTFNKSLEGEIEMSYVYMTALTATEQGLHPSPPTSSTSTSTSSTPGSSISIISSPTPQEKHANVAVIAGAHTGCAFDSGSCCVVQEEIEAIASTHTTCCN